MKKLILLLGSAFIAFFSVQAQREVTGRVTDVKVTGQYKDENGLIADMVEKIKSAGYTIGHLKFLLSNDEWQQKISYTTNYRKEQTIATVHNCKHIDLLINVRVQASPAQLQSLITNTIHEAMMQTGCRIVKHKSSAFQPGYPKPVHRIAE